MLRVLLLKGKLQLYAYSSALCRGIHICRPTPHGSVREAVLSPGALTGKRDETMKLPHNMTVTSHGISGSILEMSGAIYCMLKGQGDVIDRGPPPNYSKGSERWFTDVPACLPETGLIGTFFKCVVLPLIEVSRRAPSFGSAPGMPKGSVLIARPAVQIICCCARRSIQMKQSCLEHRLTDR